MQTGFSVISLFACGRTKLPTLLLTCLQESGVVLQKSTQLIGWGGAPSLGAHGSITAKRVEAGRGIASCCGRMCVTLHQKQFGSAGGHALTTQGVGGRVGCLAGRNQGAKQLAIQPAGPS